MSDDDDDDNEEGSVGEDEDLAILQSTLNVSHRSGGGAGPSGADRPVSVTAEEHFAQKRATSSQPRGPSLKCPYATIEGG